MRRMKVKVKTVKLGSKKRILGTPMQEAARRIRRRPKSKRAVLLSDAMREAIVQTGSLKSLVGQEVIFTKAEFVKKKRGRGTQLVINAAPVQSPLPPGAIVIRKLDKLYVRLNLKEGVAGIYSTHDKASKDMPDGTLVTWARFIE